MAGIWSAPIGATMRGNASFTNFTVQSTCLDGKVFDENVLDGEVFNGGRFILNGDILDGA